MGVVVVMSLSAGFITPPYGLCLLMASSIASLSITSAVKAILPFFVAILLIILLAVVFPEIVMFLPKLLVPKFL
jgi:TRAP-type C4-dicarboxylate transport system permease large subunit